MNFRYIDAHAHIHGKEFDLDRNEVILRMKDKEVACITVGTSLSDSKKTVELSEKNDHVWATIGIHPTDTKEKFDEKEFMELVKSKKVVAVGECGLDYYRLTTDNQQQEKERQKENFVKQVEFAIKYNKPLMIHCRPSLGTNDAHEEMISILTNYKLQTTNYKLAGNIHFFTGTIEIAQKYFDLGFTVSLSGVITFAKDLEAMVKSLPLSKILSETDCPYASPVPYRGKRNEPSHVVETLKYMAFLRGETEKAVSEAVWQNATNLFNLGPP